MKYLCYRGEHGPWEGGLSSRLGAITFSTREAASEYALYPNDRSMQPVAPRVIKAVVSIERPVMNDPTDPFIDLSILRQAIGRDAARRVAIKYEAHVENTSNWCDEINGQGDWDSVVEYLDADLAHMDTIYLNAWPVFDDADVVAACKAAGYDGAIHQGCGATSCDPEYKIFELSQAAFALSELDPIYDEIVVQH